MTRRSCALALTALLGRNLPRAGQNAPSSDTVARPRPTAETPPSTEAAPPPSESAPPPAEPKTSIRVDVELVNVLFSVRKKESGELVGNLTKDDFTVLEEGKEQTIAQFSRDTDLPLKLGLLIDVSRSQTRLLGDERNAASKFISSVMRARDEAFLISFGKDTTLEQDFTQSAARMEEALKRVQGDSGYGGRSGGGSPGGGGGGGRPGGGGGGRRGGHGTGQSQSHGGTKLYDAIYLACHDELSAKAGRKAILLITDGNDRGSYYTRSKAVEAAQRADTIVYSIYYVDTGLQHFGRADDDSAGFAGLRDMAFETGGRTFIIDKKHTLQEAFADIQDEMRSQYAIAWKPAGTDHAGAFREIEVRPKSGDYLVQARKGYYAIAAKGV